MTTTELKARIQSAREKIAKKKATIAKKTAWIALKKKDAFEIEWLQDDIKRLNSEIAETEKTITKYEAQLAGEIEREQVLLTEIPVQLKALQFQLEEKWNTDDMKKRDFLKEEYARMGRDFWNQYKRAGFEFMHRTDEEIRKANARDARGFVIDLFYRIRDITGEVTSWAGIHCGGNALNGIVQGKEGRAKVETILAGGYNIQRLHVRVLVHSI